MHVAVFVLFIFAGKHTNEIFIDTTSNSFRFACIFFETWIISKFRTHMNTVEFGTALTIRSADETNREEQFVF